MLKPSLGMFSCIFLLLARASLGQDCLFGSARTTDDFFFTASSDQGAVGDVVGVDISLRVESVNWWGLSGLAVVLCYDDSVAELLDEVRYSEVFEQLSYARYFYRLGGADGAQRPDGAKGLVVIATLGERFPTSGVIPLMTVFFRLKGKPGDASPVRFCTFTGWTGECVFNQLIYSRPVESFAARSTRHQHGILRVLEGEPTRPDPPSLPPNAKVYPQPPSAKDTNIHFEVRGAIVSPAVTEVSLPLFITSNYEFSGFSVGLRFPPSYLELARVEEHTLPGAVQINNERGGLGIYMANSRRRVGAEGERVHVATLHFDINQAARNVQEIPLTFHQFGGFLNWVLIQHEGGINTAPLPITTEVGPLMVIDGLVRIQRQPTSLGDVDLNYELELTDAVVILGELFLGERRILCDPAADFNEDGKVNLTDPIGILLHLFLGGPPTTLSQDVFCDG